jgi:hypothetical protein
MMPTCTLILELRNTRPGVHWFRFFKPAWPLFYPKSYIYSVLFPTHLRGGKFKAHVGFKFQFLSQLALYFIQKAIFIQCSFQPPPTCRKKINVFERPSLPSRYVHKTALLAPMALLCAEMALKFLFQHISL